MEGNGSGRPWRYPAASDSTAAVRTLEHLAKNEGPPLSTGELAHICGMSQTFLRDEIRNGYLHAIRVGHGRRSVFRIPFTEARRYVRQLGLL